jgi:hypothetical protein
MLERSPRRPGARLAPSGRDSPKGAVEDCLNPPLASVWSVRIADYEAISTVSDHVDGSHRILPKLIRKLSVKCDERLPTHAFGVDERDLICRDSRKTQIGKPFYRARIGGRILPMIAIEGIVSARIRWHARRNRSRRCARRFRCGWNNIPWRASDIAVVHDSHGHRNEVNRCCANRERNTGLPVTKSTHDESILAPRYSTHMKRSRVIWRRKWNCVDSFQTELGTLNDLTRC